MRKAQITSDELAKKRKNELNQQEKCFKKIQKSTKT